MTDTVRDRPLSPRPVARTLSLSVFRHRGEQRVDCRGCEAKINPFAPAAGEHRVDPAGEHPHRRVRGRLACTVGGLQDGDATVVSVFTQEGRLALPAWRRSTRSTRHRPLLVRSFVSRSTTGPLGLRSELPRALVRTSSRCGRGRQPLPRDCRSHRRSSASTGSSTGRRQRCRSRRRHRSAAG